MNYKNLRENIISVEKIISLAEITVIGSDLIHSFLSIRYIRKAQSDRHSGLGTAG